MRSFVFVFGLAALVLTACDDEIFGSGQEAVELQGDDWCAMEELWAASCVSGCHNAAGALGGLNLETDPHSAIVGVTSAAYGEVLVAPGDPDGSLLYRKCTGEQGAGEGGSMPLGSRLDEASAAALRTWIVSGATQDCDS